MYQRKTCRWAIVGQVLLARKKGLICESYVFFFFLPQFKNKLEGLATIMCKFFSISKVLCFLVFVSPSKSKKWDDDVSSPTDKLVSVEIQRFS